MTRNEMETRITERKAEARKYREEIVERILNFDRTKRDYRDICGMLEYLETMEDHIDLCESLLSGARTFTAECTVKGFSGGDEE